MERDTGSTTEQFTEHLTSLTGEKSLRFSLMGAFGTVAKNAVLCHKPTLPFGEKKLMTTGTEERKLKLS